MTQVIQGALHILAPMICEREGVKLRIGGSQAYCSEKDGITLPTLPTGSSEARILGLAFLNHELEHFEDSDFGVIQSLTRAEHGITNVLEDIRIEKNRGDRYPGAKLVFEQAESLLIRDGAYSSNADGPYDAMHDYMLTALRHLKLGHSVMAEPAARTREVLKSMVPDGVLTKLEILMDRVSGCKSTVDCVSLAKTILKMVEDEKDEIQPPPQQPQQGNSTELGGDLDQSQEKQSQVSGQQSVDQQSEQGSPDQSSSQGDNGIGEHDTRMKEALESILAGESAGNLQDTSDKLAEQLNTLAVNTPADEALSQPIVKTMPIMPASPEMVNGANAATNALQRRLHALLQAKSLCQTRHVPRGSRLDTKRLPQLKTGNINVFKRRDEGLKLNTAISILVDASGSMDTEDRISLARQAALAAGIAFSSLSGVVVSVYAFPYANGHITPLVKFGERVVGKSGQFELLSPNGGTPMGEAMIHAGKELMKRREPRKILLVATDGGPANRAGCIGLIHDMEDMGIETLGLGIKTTAVEDLFGVTSTINEVSELAQAMIGMLQDQLFGRQAA